MYTIKLPFSDVEIDLNLYNRGDYILIEKEYDVGEDRYYFYFKYEFKNLNVYFYEVAKVVDGERIFVSYNLDGLGDIKFKYAEYYFYQVRQFINEYYNKLVNEDISALSDDIVKFGDNISNMLKDVENDFSHLEDGIDEVKNNVGNSIEKLDDIKSSLSNLSIDLSPVLNKLDDVKFYLESMDLEDVINKINSLFNVVNAMNNALDVSSLLDEKLSNVLAMVSLNGSNGAKFKDGDKVLVKGYIGDWEVLSSHIILTADNTNTIVYQVKQNDRIMLVPASFVTQGD